MKLQKLIFFMIMLMAERPLSAQVEPSDKDATPETKRLFTNMHQLMQKGYLVGHQDDLAYGVYWKYEEGKSDVKDVTGDYPGIYGWELGGIELGNDKNLDGVPFSKMRNFIESAYRRGAVITISWHCSNPKTGKNAWDAAPGSVKTV